MKTLIAIIVSSISLSITSAQTDVATQMQHELDSFRQLLSTASTDADLCKIYHNIARNSDDVDSLEYYEQKAVSHASKINDFYICAAAYYNIGWARLAKEDFANAILFTNKSLSFVRRADTSTVGIIHGRSYMQLANAYFFQGNQKMHNCYIDSAIMVQRAIGDTLELFVSYMILANNACSSGLFDLALEHYETCKQLSTDCGNIAQALICNIYISNVYQQRYKCYSNTSDLNNAIKFLRIATQVLDYKNQLEQEDYYSFQDDLFSLYLGEAQCHLFMYQRTNDELYIDSCETAINKASQISIGSEEHSKSIELHSVRAFAEMAKGNYQKALDIANDKMHIAEDDTTMVLLASNKYEILAHAYEKLGRHHEALEAYKKWSETIYKFVNDGQMRQAVEYKDKLKHDEDLRQVELENLRQQMEKQNEVDRSRIIARSMAIGLILLILFVVYILRLLSNKKRLNQQLSEKNATLNEYNEEIMAQRDQLNAKNNQIFESINYAKYIQTAVVSSASEVNRLFADSFVYFQPKDIVSGDWYHVDHFYGLRIVVVADCTGHGVPGALLSMLGISTLKEILAKSAREDIRPAYILDQMRQSIVTSLSDQHDEVYKAEDGMDISICIVDADNMQLLFGAANQDITIVCNGKPTRYKGDRMPIGRYSIDYKPFSEQTIPLQQADMIYMYTDGIKDQHGKNGRKFLYKNQSALLSQMASLPANAQLQLLTQTITNFSSTEEQTDDMTMLGFRI